VSPVSQIWKIKTSAASIAAALVLLAAPIARADDIVPLSVALKDHHFAPAEIEAPANKKIVLEVSNQDSTPAELESKALRVEKVVAGGGKISVQIRGLAPGRYRFFDDYHEDTAEGFLVVK
jgi:hypothetical protein